MLDKIFSIIFVILLFIPIIKVDLSEVSKKENRTLAKLEKISDFDNWINDRFYLRSELIELNHNIFYTLALRYPHINNRLIDKKTKELNRYTQQPVYKQKLKPNEYKEFVRGIQKGLMSFNDFCIENDIKLYILILPEKESVHHPSVVQKYNDKEIIEFVNEINPNNSLNIIFPIKELQKGARKEYMFFKTDHHLTNDGYFIAYQELMKVIKKDFPDVKILQKDEFDKFTNNKIGLRINSQLTRGSLCKTVGLEDKICRQHLDTYYVYYNYKNSKKLNHEFISTNKLHSQEFYYPEGNKMKLLIIGNSNTDGLCKFIPYSFVNTQSFILNYVRGIERKEQYKIVKYYKKEIEKFKPNIIVLCIGYDVIKYLSDIDNKL